MIETPLLTRLVDALQCMPGIGKKSAQRIAYQLLQKKRHNARELAAVLMEAMDKIGHCQVCRTFTEHEVCAVCASPKRDRTLMCVVESPADVYAIEEAHYKGLYFVLMGHLSPLDGVGPDELGLDRFEQLLNDESIEEIILATGTTVEGEATAHYISEMVKKRGLRVSRLALGIPMGGDLEYIDSNTLSHALNGRRPVD